MSEEMDWLPSPPLSPRLGKSNEVNIDAADFEENEDELFLLDSNCDLDSKRSRCFNCLGELSRNSTDFSDESFLHSGEMAALFTDTIPFQSGNRSMVSLFGEMYSEGAALYLHKRHFFKEVRKRFLLIDSGSKCNTISTVSKARNHIPINYAQLRKEICEFFAYTRLFFSSISSCEEHWWMVEKLMPEIRDNLLSLRLLLRSLTDLPDFILSHYPSVKGNKCNLPVYHLFHLHLDLRWYHLTLTSLVEKNMSLMNLDDASPSFDMLGVRRNKFDVAVLLLMADLINIAVSRFDKLQITDLQRKSPFTCSCVKELWLMIRLYLDRLCENSVRKGFWSYCEELLQTLLNGQKQSTANVHSCSELHVPQKFECRNPIGFSLWLLSNLAELYLYDEQGRITRNIQVKSAYPLLETVLKKLLNSDSQVSELHMRVYISQVALLLELWDLRSEPVVALWEYFHRKLNSHFLIPGAPPDELAVMSKSALGLLDQLKKSLDPSHRNKCGNSFSTFLHLLGNHLNKCMTSGQQRLWQQIRGRIYSKFSPQKMKSLTELGLYNFFSLFLTLAVTINVQEVSEKLQDLLRMLPDKLDVAKREMIWRGDLAFILLHIENQLDISCIANHFLNDLSTISIEISQRKSTEMLPLIRIFVEGLQDITFCSQHFNLSEHLLIGSWFPQFVSVCSMTDACRVLDAILAIITKERSLNRSYSLGSLEAGSQDQMIKMLSSLFRYILPYIKQQCSASNAPFQVADLAASFTMVSLDFSGKEATIGASTFIQNFQYFACSDTVNIRICRRYLCHLLAQEIVMEALAVQLPDHQCTIVQAWIRCSLLSTDACCDELMDIMRIVFKLPSLAGICDHALVKSLRNADDPFCSLIENLQSTYNTLQECDRPLFRQQWNSYFAQMEKYMLPFIKNPTEGDIVRRIYWCAGYLLLYCSEIIYRQSNTKCLLPVLIGLLLLPRTVYDMESSLHGNISAALKKSLPLFIKGLALLKPKQDPYIGRTLKDVIILYLPRLTGRKGGTCASVHPIVDCFEDLENPKLEDGLSFTLHVIATTFLTPRGRAAPNYVTQALKILLDIVNLRRQRVFSLVVANVLLSLMELLLFIEDLNIKKQGWELLQLIMKNGSSVCSSDIQTVLLQFVRRHLAFSATKLLHLLHALAQKYPDILMLALPEIKAEVEVVERRRGVGCDAVLRQGLERIENALGLQNIFNDV